MFYPCSGIEWMLGAPRDRTDQDLAAIIFSSGSEGEPKGVMLTHRNIASNIEGTMQVFPYELQDCFVGMLPFFHSLGFMATIWAPLTKGLRVVYHPNPLEPHVIGNLIQKHQCSYLMATPTLLQNFIRRCTPKQMSSLKHIVCGAEKLTDRVREACKEKFGIEPVEGYGVTECAPIVSLNVPNLRIPGFFQRGTKPGTVGHPIPGVRVKTVEPGAGNATAINEAGMVWVKGPNVMQGYLNKPEKTAEVLQDGWYNTGDMGFIDEEGFLTITGRLSRFSKIGGEMVPHGAEQALAVVGVPDEKKGERLIVLHTLSTDLVEQLQAKLKDSALPRLWIPARDAYRRIDSIPMLGAGKIDLSSLRELAEAA